MFQRTAVTKIRMAAVANTSGISAGGGGGGGGESFGRENIARVLCEMIAEAPDGGLWYSKFYRHSSHRSATRGLRAVVQPTQQAKVIRGHQRPDVYVRLLVICTPPATRHQSKPRGQTFMMSDCASHLHPACHPSSEARRICPIASHLHSACHPIQPPTAIVGSASRRVQSAQTDTTWTQTHTLAGVSRGCRAYPEY